MYWLKVEDDQVVAAVPEGEDGFPKFVAPAKVTETGGTWHRTEASYLSEAVSKLTIHLMGAQLKPSNCDHEHGESCSECADILFSGKESTNAWPDLDSLGRAENKSGTDPWPFLVKEVGYGDGTHDFTASLPFREGVEFKGATRDEAIGNLIRGYAELAWEGFVNPYAPHRRGVPAIQHVLEILVTRLEFEAGLRRSDWQENVLTVENVAAAQERQTTAGGAWLDTPQFKRRNDVISGIATAIAALARVKEL